MLSLVDAQHYPHLMARVRAQGDVQPALFGRVDFERRPHRLATELEDRSTLPRAIADRRTLLQDDRLVELVSTTTLLGDVVADPYASLMADRSFKSLVDQLQQACRHGVDAVADAPPELLDLIAAMEDSPSWLDMELVEKGSRLARVQYAFLAPFIARGTLFATFMNTYSALPMALTGALGGRKAARRVNETVSFFSLTTLPGALERHGPGFEAAAMVRLMHSMVRYNALTRSDRWDVSVYGIPVPQIDQVPAGLLGIYLLAVQARGKGRAEFTPDERAMVEFNRYRCFLLGLPEELLPSSIDEVIRIMHGRAALLREDFDDETCGALIRATMDANLRPGDSLMERLAEELERSWSKVFFVRSFGRDGRAEAAGVRCTPGDYVRVAATAPFILGRLVAVDAAVRRGPLQPLADTYTLHTLRRRLVAYGRPEFTSDAATYTPVHGGATTVAT